MPHPKPICESHGCIYPATRLAPSIDQAPLQEPGWWLLCETHYASWYPKPEDLERLGPGFLLVRDAGVQREEWRDKRV